MIEDTYNAPFGPDAPNAWLSRDDEEVRKYNADVCCGFPLTSQAWLDLLNARVAQGFARALIDVQARGSRAAIDDYLAQG